MKKIVICGSTKFAEEMKSFSEELESFGFEVIFPKVDISDEDIDKFPFAEKQFVYNRLITNYFKHISESDAVFIYNKNGYIGTSVTMELAYAFAMKKPIYAFHADEDITRGSLITKITPTSNELVELLK